MLSGERAKSCSCGSWHEHDFTRYRDLVFPLACATAYYLNYASLIVQLQTPESSDVSNRLVTLTTWQRPLGRAGLGNLTGKQAC